MRLKIRFIEQRNCPDCGLPYFACEVVGGRFDGAEIARDIGLVFDNEGMTTIKVTRETPEFYQPQVQVGGW